MMKRKWLPALLGALLLAALCGAAQAQQLAPETAQAGLVPHSLGAQPWFSSSDTEITPFDRAQTLL